jgi:hypothetical protein
MNLLDFDVGTWDSEMFDAEPAQRFALGDRIGQVVVVGLRPVLFKPNVHDDCRDVAGCQLPDHPGVHVARERPLSCVQAKLLGRALVDAHDDDVWRRLEGTPHGEQPAEPNILLQPQADTRGAQDDTKDADDESENDRPLKPKDGDQPAAPSESL